MWRLGVKKRAVLQEEQQQIDVMCQECALADVLRVLTEVLDTMPFDGIDSVSATSIKLDIHHAWVKAERLRGRI